MASQHYQSHTCAPVVCTGFVQGTKKQNSRSIHTAASFICKAYMHMALKKCHLPVPPQTVLKVSARVEKSVPLYRGDNEFSILTGGTFTFKTVSPYRSICVAHVFSKTTFSGGLMITKLKSNTKTTGWNKRPGASPTLTIRRNSPGTSRESIANQKDL